MKVYLVCLNPHLLGRSDGSSSCGSNSDIVVLQIGGLGISAVQHLLLLLLEHRLHKSGLVDRQARRTGRLLLPGRVGL